MSKISVSFICTVFNEADNLRRFLDSIYAMSRLPDEIVIVDAGSRDGTIGILEEYTRTNPSFHFFVEQGCNIARGRNIAIGHTRFDYIAMADAGSRLDTSWLEYLIAPFEQQQGVEIVGGRTEMEAVSGFERWAGMLNKPFDRINLETYLPTGRSLAVKKECWAAVGGFPEELTMWSEDTVFLQRLKSKNFKLTFAPESVVYWRPRRNVSEFWTQYYRYGKGDGEAGVFLRLYGKRTALLLSVIVLLLGKWINPVIPIISLCFLAAAFVRLAIPLKSSSVSVWKLAPLFLLILLMEFAQVFGYPVGRLTRRRKK